MIAVSRRITFSLLKFKLQNHVFRLLPLSPTRVVDLMAKLYYSFPTKVGAG